MRFRLRVGRMGQYRYNPALNLIVADSGLMEQLEVR